MKVLKILNNNVVIALNDNNKEVIVVKRGIGFSKKAGDRFPKTDDLKIFVLSTEEQNQYSQLVKGINPDALDIAEKVIQYAATEKNLQLNPIIHLTLADHIDGVLTRLKQEIQLTNQLTLEIRRIYETEFDVGLYAKRKIEEKTNKTLLIDEAAFIALNIVNSLKGSTAKPAVDSATVLQFIQDIFTIVEKYFKRTYEEDSIAYIRFMRHLKFLCYRVYEDREYTDDPLAYETLSKAYPESSKCVSQINRALELKYKKSLTDEEKSYLTIYVEKLNQ